MASEEQIILVIAVTIEIVVGIALNLHILLVYIGNLKNGLPLGPSDKIHLTKALVNVFLHGMTSTQFIRYVFWPQLYFDENFFLVKTFRTFLNFYSYWLTAVLCVYYCTNITTCGHHIIVWLKRSLSSYLLHILLGSGLGSVVKSISLFWFCTMEPAGNSTDQTTNIQGTFPQAVMCQTIFSILGCFLPLTIAVVSTAFTSWSLLHHMWRMKQNNPGFTRSKFQTQINATRTMILFLLNVIICGVAQIFFTISPRNISDGVMTAIWFVLISYPTSEAVIITQSSAKLRNSLLEKFLCRNRRNTET